MIEVHDLHVRYPNCHTLKGIDLSIPSHSFTLIGGPSGSGKSTLAHTLMGLVPQTTPAEIKGHVSIADLDPRRTSTAHIATRVGLVFQNPATQLLNGTVKEEVAFGPRNLGLPPAEIAARVKHALEAIGCTHLQHRPVRRLSSGEQQRVAIAAALSMQPNALILDEPTANLDGDGVQQLVRILSQLHDASGITLAIIEHRLSPFLPHADRLLWLEDGRIVAQGPPAETLARISTPPPKAPPAPHPAVNPLVTLREITAGYHDHPVLQDCSLTLCRGEFAALVGPNSSGKTTLARVLAGLLRPRRGRVVWHTNGKRPRVGLLQQNPLHQLVCDTVEEEVHFGPRNLRLNHDTTNLIAKTDLLPLLHRSTRALSVGQQQRTALAATLALEPALLILDEPTMGQDRQHLTRMMDFVSGLNRAGQTTLLITHDRDLVKRYANRILTMSNGRIQGAGGGGQEAGGRRQEAGGRKQEARNRD